MTNVLFRAFEEHDYILINKWRNDPKLQVLTGGNFRYISLEIEKNWVKEKILNNRTEIYLAICLNDESRKMIGYVSINKIDHLNRTAEGGGLIIGDNDYRDGLIWVECYQFIMSYVFEILNINRFYAYCFSEHKTSIALLSIMKFTNEGLCKQVVYKNGKYHDIVLWAILSEDYFKHKIKGDFEISAFLSGIRKFKMEQNKIGK